MGGGSPGQLGSGALGVGQVSVLCAPTPIPPSQDLAVSGYRICPGAFDSCQCALERDLRRTVHKLALALFHAQDWILRPQGGRREGGVSQGWGGPEVTFLRKICRTGPQPETESAQS